MSQDLFLLLVSGGLFALLFMLNAIVHTIRRTERIGFLDTLLAFLTTLVLLAAMIANHMQETPLRLADRAVAGIALVTLLFSVMIAIAEWRRPQRLRQSRGVLGIGSGILILISMLTVPFAAAYFVTPTPIMPTAVANVTTATPSGQARALSVFNTVVQIVADETSLGADTIVSRLQSGETIAHLVEENGGDLDTVVDRITTIISDQVRALTAEQRMTQAASALALSQMEFIVWLAVNQPLDSERFDRLLNGSSEASSAESATGTPARATHTPAVGPSATSTASPARVVTATPTRTPLPTATSTRPPILSPTPAPTLPDCQIVMNYNVNLRAAPDFAAQVLLTIPFNTSVSGVGRSQDATWWLVGYEGQAGWVSNDYVAADSRCSELPAQ